MANKTLILNGLKLGGGFTSGGEVFPLSAIDDIPSLQPGDNPKYVTPWTAIGTLSEVTDKYLVRFGGSVGVNSTSVDSYWDWTKIVVPGEYVTFANPSEAASRRPRFQLCIDGNIVYLRMTYGSEDAVANRDFMNVDWDCAFVQISTYSEMATTYRGDTLSTYLTAAGRVEPSTTAVLFSAVPQTYSRCTSFIDVNFVAPQAGQYFVKMDLAATHPSRRYGGYTASYECLAEGTLANVIRPSEDAIEVRNAVWLEESTADTRVAESTASDEVTFSPAGEFSVGYCITVPEGKPFVHLRLSIEVYSSSVSNVLITNSTEAFTLHNLSICGYISKYIPQIMVPELFQGGIWVRSDEPAQTSYDFLMRELS